MFNHFACIGLGIDDAEKLRAAVAQLGALALEEARLGKERHLRWTDPSGASLAFHLADGEVACITPFFMPTGGLTRWTVASHAPRDDRDCRHCGGVDCDVLVGGELATRTTVQLLHARPFRAWLAGKRSYELELTAFAHRLEVFAGAADLEAAPPAWFGSLRLAPDAFLPMGMFKDTGDVSVAATVVLVGKVVLAERLQMTRGGPFWRLRIETLPGLLDVVAPDEALAGAPPAGAVAAVEAWLVGRPVAPVPTDGWLRRLLG